jgi:hypothetical protein
MGLRFICVAVVFALGCGRTFSGVAQQPNPLRAPANSPRGSGLSQPQSDKITIVTGDMELRMPKLPTGSRQIEVYSTHRYPLLNEARFVVVSHDRLRFHVQIDHKWDDWANIKTWDAELVDDTGHHYTPDSIERAKTRLMVTMWDTEIRTPVRNTYGDIVAVENDGWKRRTPLGSLSVFRGTADLVFYQRDIFRPDIKWLRLKLSRFGQSFVFTWKFADEELGDSGERPVLGVPGA